MSGPYNDPCFPPVRAASPQIIRHTPAVVESRQYLAELIAEDQKLGPFMQVLPVCGHLLNQGHKGNDHLTSSSPSSGLSPAVCSGFREILRVSGIFPNQGFREFGGLRYGSPSPLASPGTLLNFSGAGGLGGWSSPLQEDITRPSDIPMASSAQLLATHTVQGHRKSNSLPCYFLGNSLPGRIH